jgi:methanogenic corrinoid protein MtbC1
MSDELATAISDLEEGKVLQLVQQRLDRGEDALAILASCQEGMTLVGKRYEAGEYFISDLMMSGELFKRATEALGPRIETGARVARGKVVFGTVKGDIHNIGKDLVVGLLRASGYDVTDLGVDVPSEKFVDAVKQTGAKVVGLSGLLTVAFDSMKETVAALSTAGLRPDVKVMIGGGAISTTVQQYTGADAWGTDARAAVSFCNEWIKEVANG